MPAVWTAAVRASGRLGHVIHCARPDPCGSVACWAVTSCVTTITQLIARSGEKTIKSIFKTSYSLGLMAINSILFIIKWEVQEAWASQFVNSISSVKLVYFALIAVNQRCLLSHHPAKRGRF